MRTRRYLFRFSTLFYRENTKRTFSTSNTTKPSVVVGMSGGVDSSVSAYLLKQQGYNVTGLFMTNWDKRDEKGVCSSDEDRRDAAIVCKQLDIPFHEVNFVKDYWSLVFERAMIEFEQGLTPNPDVLCNRYIKFDAFVKHAIEKLGANYVATGHYCRTKTTSEGRVLLSGVDPIKDQSYFLSMIRPGSLDSVLFPVGEMLKSGVKEIARQQGLISADRKNSVGFCFVGKRKFSDFISEYIPDKVGDIILLDKLNNEIPISLQHRGLHNYTIGQRVGVDDIHPPEKLYVCHKDKEKNILYIAPYGHTAFFSDSLTAYVSWIKGKPPASKFRCFTRCRYRQKLLPATVTIIESQDSDENDPQSAEYSSSVLVEFDHPHQSATEGQIVVFYQEEVCLGGGFIRKIGPSYYQQQKTF